MKEQNELEHLFSSTFDGFEVTPPSHIKSAIDESLFSGKTPVHKKRGFIWLFPVIGLFFIGSFISLSFKTRQQSLQTNSENTVNSTENKFALNQESRSKSTMNKEKSSMNASEDKTKISNIDGHQSTFSFDKKDQSVSKDQTKLSDNKTVQGKIGSKTVSKKRLKSNRGHEFSGKANHTTIKGSKGNKDIETKKDQGFIDEPDQYAGLSSDNSADNTSKSDAENVKENEKESADLAKNEQIGDSSQTTSSASNTGQENPGKIKPQDNLNPSKWSIGLYAGTFFGVNSLSSNSNNYYEIKSPAGFNSSFEVNYGLNSKWSITAGLSFSTFNERVSAVIYDTTFIPNGTTVEYIYLNPALQDSIIDSIVTVNYITEIAESNVAQKINYSVFSLPIYGSFSIFNKGYWSSSLMAGIRLNYNKATVTNLYEGIPGALISTPEIKQFGLSVALRPEITYSFDKFGLGVYLNTSFDLIPITRWTDIDKQRYDFGGGVVFKYRF